MAGDKDKQQQFRKKFGDKQVGKPFATDRDSVEEGQEREGTNLDLGEERSDEQLEEIEDLKEDQGS